MILDEFSMSCQLLSLIANPSTPSPISRCPAIPLLIDFHFGIGIGIYARGPIYLHLGGSPESTKAKAQDFPSIFDLLHESRIIVTPLQ